MKMLYVSEEELNTYTLVSDCGLYAIRPIRMNDGFALPVSLLTNPTYEWAWPLLSTLEIREMNNIQVDDVPDFIKEEK